MSADNYMQQVADEARADRYDDPPEMPDVFTEIMDEYETCDAARRWIDGVVEAMHNPIHPDGAHDADGWWHKHPDCPIHPDDQPF